VLITNTGGDRLFDWMGEFNSYFAPFSLFGSVAVVRLPSPALIQFLRDMGRGSGADQGLTEPNGELGLFTQSDPEWGQNNGSPRDPQAGNSKGKVDTQGAPEDDRGTALPLSASLASGASQSFTVSPTSAQVQADVQANSFDVTVDNVVVSKDPSKPSQLALFVGGASGDDIIEVRPGASAGILQVVVNGTVRGKFARSTAAGAIGRLVIYGNGGNDAVTVNSGLDAIAAVLYGGDGNDTLRAGKGASVLDGGDGNDILYGSDARNVLIGGLGQDSLNGGAGDDLLIGGTYLNSQELDAIAAVLTEWTSSRTYSQRIANLRSGVGSFAQYKLSSSTILDDLTPDYLIGSNKGQDWFWAFGGDRTDKNGTEVLN